MAGAFIDKPLKAGGQPMIIASEEALPEKQPTEKEDKK